MSHSDHLMETLQADVFGTLQATPALALANLLLNNAGDTDSKIENALKTLTATGGKRGLALVVLRPEVSQAEPGLPGPPLTLKIEVQCIEQVLLNRGADGTQVRSSQAALNVLAALHLRHLGHCLLYADKDPVQPVQVKAGFVSDSVTLFARFAGLVLAKPAGVEATMAADVLTLQTAAPEATIRYTTDGSFPGPAATLYSVPLTGLASGTTVRAAAHVAALGISDVLELEVL